MVQGSAPYMITLVYVAVAVYYNGFANVAVAVRCGEGQSGVGCGGAPSRLEGVTLLARRDVKLNVTYGPRGSGDEKVSKNRRDWIRNCASLISHQSLHKQFVSQSCSIVILEHSPLELDSVVLQGLDDGEAIDTVPKALVNPLLPFLRQTRRIGRRSVGIEVVGVGAKVRMPLLHSAEGLPGHYSVHEESVLGGLEALGCQIFQKLVHIAPAFQVFDDPLIPVVGDLTRLAFQPGHQGSELG